MAVAKDQPYGLMPRVNLTFALSSQPCIFNNKPLYYYNCLVLGCHNLQKEQSKVQNYHEVVMVSRRTYVFRPFLCRLPILVRSLDDMRAPHNEQRCALE